MGKWQVTALVETIYHVEADSEEEAIEKAVSGETEEEEYGGIHEIMSAEEVGQ